MAHQRDDSPDRVPDLRAMPRQPDDPEVPPVVHPGDERLPPSLRFTREEDRRDRDALLARAAGPGFASLRPLSWASIQTLQLSTRAAALLGPHWRTFFTISESVCTDLAIEFFSTVHMLTPLIDYAREDAITFRLGGVHRSLSLRQFAVHMGLYSEAELDTPAFTEGIITWPSETDFIQFWSEIATGPYTHPLPKSTVLRDPLHRIIHRAIAHSIAPRSGSAAGNVTRTDLLYLFCMVRSIPCQIAERLARLLFGMRRERDTREIFGGGFILRLARSMGIMPPDDIEALPTIAEPAPIDTTTLVRMGVAKKEGRGYILIGRDGRPYDHARAHDHEAGPSRPRGGDAGASGSGGQADTSTEVPFSEAPVPPPIQISQTIADLPRPPVAHTFTRDHGPRLLRLEESHAQIRAALTALTEVHRLEFAHAEEHRSYVTSMLQLLAEDAMIQRTLPRPPVRPQELTDFIRGGPAPTPDPDQPPTSS